MGWGFKPFDELTRAGADFFEVVDPDAPGGFRRLSLADDYTQAAALTLPSSVPQGVRDYFDGTRMLWVHGWFYYPFYSMAAVHSYFCAELALKTKLRAEGINLRKRPSFSYLIDVAIRREWFNPLSFGTIRRRVERERVYAELEEDASATISTTSRAYEVSIRTDMERLLHHIPHFRNTAAHPDGITLWLPGMTYIKLEFVRDTIAQLFPPDGGVIERK